LNSRPAATADGSGMVMHDIHAEGSEDSGPWQNTGMHKTIAVPEDELLAALSAGSNPEVIAEYKAALVANVNTTPASVVGWTPAILEVRMEANQASVLAADGADEFIADTLGLSYPVPFTI
jgi:hypothetical protein